MKQNGSYRIDVNSASKTIDMKVEGSFTPKQAEDFHNDYQKRVASVDASIFKLRVNCENMDVITQDMIPALEVSFKMYKDSQFNSVEFLIHQNPIIKMQLKRIARNVGLSNADVVEV